MSTTWIFTIWLVWDKDRTIIIHCFTFLHLLLVCSTGAVAGNDNWYTLNSIPDLINDINCTGNEQSLLDCSFTSANYSCYTSGMANVLCQSKIT